MMTSPQRAIVDQTTAVAVVKMLTGSTTAPRLAMGGTSMVPLLREPMVLELGPSGLDDRIGDILVFERNGQLVAHRITGFRDRAPETCGDALPWGPEYPERHTIVGKVVAVFASDHPDAPRIDSRLFRVRGFLKARLRRVRAIPFQARILGRRFWRALPWNRQRSYVALVNAMSAVVRDDPAGFEDAVTSIDPISLAAIARRHRCGATLLDGARVLKCSAFEGRSLRGVLQPLGRSVILRSFAVKAQIVAMAASFSRAQIPFALLKGAARLYRDEPDAMLQSSVDIDVLVPAADLDAAAATLRADGYDERAYAELREAYRAGHHHAAPLFPPGSGCTVELHSSLAPPHALSIALDWESLADHMVWVDGPAGRVSCLDGVGTAVHLAAHSIGLLRLRDSVLLARLLQRMNETELGELRRIASLEQTDPIRLDAAIAFAATIAGVAWPASKQVREYLSWCTRREDVPLYFAHRSQFVEAWYAGGRRFSRCNWHLIDPRAGLRISRRGESPVPLRIIGRAVTSACAFAYALALRRPA